MVLAEVFHPLAREKHGDGSAASLRRVLEEMFCSPDSKYEWERGKEKALEALRAEGFKGQQLSAVGAWMDLFPEALVAFFIEFTARLKVIPMREVSGISGILAQMMTEDKYPL